jgi:hypothetical protein
MKTPRRPALDRRASRPRQREATHAKDVFDDDQLSAMKRAIDQIILASGEGANLSRHEVAHAVFVAASEDGEFDPGKVTRMARERLGLCVSEAHS